MATEWIQVTKVIPPKRRMKCGAWLNHKTLTFAEWCDEHGDFQVLRNPLTLAYEVRSEPGGVALFVKRECVAAPS